MKPVDGMLRIILFAMLLSPSLFGAESFAVNGEASSCDELLRLDLNDPAEGREEGRKAFLLALYHFGEDDFVRALDKLDESLKLGFVHEDTHLVMGICRLHTGTTEQAVACFERCAEGVKDVGEAAERLNVAGKVLYTFGRFEEAKCFFMKALKRAPKRAALYSNLGSVLIELAQVQESQACFEKALELDPGLSDAHLNLGILFFMLEDFAAAEEHLKRAVELNGENGSPDPVAYGNLGDLYFVRRKLDACIDAYNKALALDSALPSIRTRLGMAYRLKGEMAHARGEFERVILEGSAPAEAHQELADILLAEGRLFEALSEYRRAAQLSDESDPEPLVALARIFMAMEQDRDAFRLYRKAFDLGHRTPKAVANLSRLAERLGREKDAVDYFRLLENGDVTDPAVLLETARLALESDLPGIRDSRKAERIARGLAQDTSFAHPGVLVVLARALADQGDYGTAAEMEDLAIRALPPNNPLKESMVSRLEEYRIKGR